ncbi:MAG: phosphatidate cytidylyltransferase [Verrucomicrobiae bacterium]|nr:phosphatidate cytidylyltransferase [Verrucomicrobiae bacterium]
MNAANQNEQRPAGPAQPDALQTRRASTFLRRVASFVVLWAVVLGAVFSGNPLVANCLFVLLITAVGVAGQLEFYGLVKRRGLACFKWLGVVGGTALMWSTCAKCLSGAGADHFGDFQTGVLACIVLGLCVRQLMAGLNQTGLTAISTTLLGVLYVPWLLNFIQGINFFPGLGGMGKYYLLYFLVVTKLSDTGAYLVGTLLGRHKLAPRISPAKTWEGFIGAIAVAVASSVLATQVAGPYLPGMDTLDALVLGAALGLGAVAGDLIESLFKREAGVKDSGGLLPGIGGVLDLLDSVLFNAPIMYLYIQHVLARP